MRRRERVNGNAVPHYTRDNKRSSVLLTKLGVWQQARASLGRWGVGTRGSVWKTTSQQMETQEPVCKITMDAA